MSAVLGRVAEALRAEGGLVADALVDAPVGDTPHGDRAAAGPRAVGREEELAFVTEAVREGYLLHYGASRLLSTDDADLALLAGDRLYALGLATLAESGDLASVAELAELIALSAVAHAGGDDALADAAWAAGSAAVGTGPLPGHADAKRAARRQDPGAAAALRAIPRQVDQDLAP